MEDTLFENNNIGVYWFFDSPDEISINLDYEGCRISIDEAYILATNLLNKIELLRKVG
jgi:hypothetical protein